MQLNGINKIGKKALDGPMKKLLMTALTERLLAVLRQEKEPFIRRCTDWKRGERCGGSSVRESRGWKQRYYILTPEGKSHSREIFKNDKCFSGVMSLAIGGVGRQGKVIDG
ncbi:hypothetical protein BH09VER1_BH09VER1_19040 [soil metagenome]